MTPKLQRVILDRLAVSRDRRTQDLLLDLLLQYREDEQERRARSRRLARTA